MAEVRSVLIPEFPFGGMEHAGATFLRESSVIFPTEPTKGDYISRANLIFHETAHQWFGDTVTMRWFDDLWLKEGFAEFMAYKTLEHVMPEANAWKVFYERNKQAAYATDSTKGTTPIYQPIDNLSAAKSAYGNIVYRKAPSFLRQAEFYLGEDKFQTAVRTFLKKHEYANAGWEDLVSEFEKASGKDATIMKLWAEQWVTQRSLPVIRTSFKQLQGEDLADLFTTSTRVQSIKFTLSSVPDATKYWQMKSNALVLPVVGERQIHLVESKAGELPLSSLIANQTVVTILLYDEGRIKFVFPNYGDYGYGIFLLDPKSREYVLHNIQNEMDPFLRSMMWGALWDSVREGEMDPREYVELAIRQLRSSVGSTRFSGPPAAPRKGVATQGPPRGGNPSGESDESTIASILGRVTTALNYYMPDDRVSSPSVSEGARGDSKAPSLTVGLRTRLEGVLMDRMQHAGSPGERITFYRAFVNIASSAKARGVLKEMLRQVSEPPEISGGSAAVVKKEQRAAGAANPPVTTGGSDTRQSSTTPAAKPATPPNQGGELKLRTKDRFDIVTRLIILGDPDAPKLLADLEKTETSDDDKRYAYAAHAAFPTAENREKFWNDFVNNKDISESWIEAAIGPFNSIRHDDLSLPYLQRALAELPNLKRSRKIFFVNGWLAAFIGGQRSQEALDIVNKFLADNPNLDKDLKLKILENVDVIERAIKIRSKWNGKS